MVGAKFFYRLMGRWEDKASICTNQHEDKKSVGAEFEVFCESRGRDHNEKSSVNSQEEEPTEEGNKEVLNLDLVIVSDEILETLNILNDGGESKESKKTAADNERSLNSW